MHFKYIEFQVFYFITVSSALWPASLPAVLLWLGLQFFHTIKVIASDLRNCCSEEYLSTAPWCFILSFITKLSSSNHLHKGEKLANRC